MSTEQKLKMKKKRLAKIASSNTTAATQYSRELQRTFFEFKSIMKKAFQRLENISIRMCYKF